MKYNVNFVLSKKTYDRELNNHYEELMAFKYPEIIDFKITPNKICVKTNYETIKYSLGWISSNECLSIDSIEILPSKINLKKEE